MGEKERRRLRAIAQANVFADVYRGWQEVPGPIRGKVTVLSIAHDLDCPAAGTGVGCICEPEVRRFLCPDE